MDKRLHIRISDKHHQMIKEMAVRRKISMGEMIEILIKAWKGQKDATKS